MIRRTNGRWVLFCDGCSNYMEFEKWQMFQDVIVEARSLGWKVRKNDEEEWEHFCPSCAEGSI